MERNEWERINAVFDTVTADTSDDELLRIAREELSTYNTAHGVFYLDLERKRKREV